MITMIVNGIIIFSVIYIITRKPSLSLWFIDLTFVRYYLGSFHREIINKESSLVVTSIATLFVT